MSKYVIEIGDRMKKTLIISLIAITILSLAAFKTSGQSGGGVEIGYCVPDTTNPFVGWLTSSVQKQADADGIRVQIADAGNNSVIQIEQIENFIAMNVKALAIMPVDPYNVQPAIEKARSQGIKVLVAGTDTTRYDVMMYMDQYLAGKMIAEMGIEWLSNNFSAQLADSTQKKPKVLIIRATTTVDMASRSNGIIEKMKEWGKANVVVATAEAQSSAAATKIMENMWQQNNDAVLILCYNADAALGVNEYLMWQTGIDRTKLAVFSGDWSPEIQEVLNASLTNNSLFRGTIQIVGPVIKGEQISFEEATYGILKGFVKGDYPWGYRIFNMIQKKYGESS